MTEFVRLEMDGAVGVIRLDRPPVNAINTVIHRELQQVAAQVAADPAIRAVVLYGGDRAFAAGADIKEMVDLNPSEIASLDGHLTDAVSAIARLPQPVIAAISGYALGGGFELALAADLRVVAENAVLGLPEITLGVIPGAGGTQRLPRLIGSSRAKELIFFGRPISGVEALAIGLATRAVPPERVFPEALQMARTLAAGATAALAAAKRAIDDGLNLSLTAGLDLESQRFAELFATEDQKIGMASFVQQGPGKAKFVGR
jgi:enoyl-CoA hydratase/carnithine racemase